MVWWGQGKAIEIESWNKGFLLFSKLSKAKKITFRFEALLFQLY